MTDHANIEELIADVERTVAEGLAFFAGLPDDGSQPTAEWVLRHMLFWHRAFVEGMESVLAGGQPFPITGPIDEMNDHAVAETIGLTTSDIVDALRDLQTRMVAAVRAFPDPEITVVIRRDGAERSASHGLRMTALHWQGHLSELGS